MNLDNRWLQTLACTFVSIATALTSACRHAGPTVSAEPPSPIEAVAKLSDATAGLAPQAAAPATPPYAGVTIWRSGVGGGTGPQRIPVVRYVNQWIKTLDVWHSGDCIRGIEITVTDGNKDFPLPMAGYQVGTKYSMPLADRETIVQVHGLVKDGWLRAMRFWAIKLDRGFNLSPLGPLKQWDTPGWGNDSANIRFDAIPMVSMPYPFEEIIGLDLCVDPQQQKATGFALRCEQAPTLQYDAAWEGHWPFRYRSGPAGVGGSNSGETASPTKDVSIKRVSLWSREDRTAITAIEVETFDGTVGCIGAKTGVREDHLLQKNHALVLVYGTFNNGYLHKISMQAKFVRRVPGDQIPALSITAKTGSIQDAPTTAPLYFDTGYGTNRVVPMTEFYGFFGTWDSGGVRSLGVLRRPSPEYASSGQGMP